MKRQLPDSAAQTDSRPQPEISGTASHRRLCLRLCLSRCLSTCSRLAATRSMPRGCNMLALRQAEADRGSQIKTAANNRTERRWKRWRRRRRHSTRIKLNEMLQNPLNAVAIGVEAAAAAREGEGGGVGGGSLSSRRLVKLDLNVAGL